MYRKFIVPAAAVCVFVFNANGNVLTVTRRNTDIVSLPGGKVDPGEDIRQAIARETLEETGIVLVESELIPLYSEIVIGDDGVDYYTTSMIYPHRIYNDIDVWSIEEGINVKFATLEELLDGAFAEYNLNALKNMQRLKFEL